MNPLSLWERVRVRETKSKELSMSEKILSIKDEDFEEEILKSSNPCLVDFWAEWCGPCKAISPLLDELAKKYSEKIKFAKLNVDENQKTPSHYGIRSIPSLLLFRDGKVIDQIVGVVPKTQIEALLLKAL